MTTPAGPLDTPRRGIGAAQPAGLYVHVPFCRSICPYCDFAVTLAGSERRGRYVEALGLEADAAGGGWSVDTVYLGGGTPSNLAGDDLAGVVRAAGRIPGAASAWKVLEANPDDVTEGSCALWRSLGFAGVSLGVQSFDATGLEFLGREHDGAVARRAVAGLREAGFAWISLDLIFGWSGQSRARWQRDLSEAVDLGPDHLSCYQLTVHRTTRFGRRASSGDTLTEPEEEVADAFLFAHDLLEGAGYEHYEVSNYARPGARSRHNQKYWTGAPYLGLGPSAHSFDTRRRWWNLDRVRLWEQSVRQSGSGRADGEVLTDADLALEGIMLGLRTSDGLDLERVSALVGQDVLEANRGLVRRLVARGHLTREGTVLRPTARGLVMADAIARAFDLPV